MKSRTLLSTVFMSRSNAVDFVRDLRKTVLGRLGLVLTVIVMLVPATGRGQFVPNAKNNSLCQKLGTQIQGSAGMQMYCFGPQTSAAAPAAARLGPGLTSAKASPQKNGGKGGFIPNVNAANTAEDISPSGVRAFGQSETSIAVAGSYVVEAWNDSTGFFSPCGSPNNKEELTGFAFSNNGGSTFTDLGGLPNMNCTTSLTEGDPSVEVYQAGGSTYFYISSIYVLFNVPQNAISVTACKVLGTGSSSTLSCGQPIIAGISSDCQNFGFIECSFLDKDFLTLDAATGKLYVSYTEFGFTDADLAGQIDLAACDLTVDPANPTCSNGSGFSFSSPNPVPAYVVVSPNDANFCEQEGAYPAVDPGSGDVYVAFEYNWASNQSSGGPCAVTPTREVLVHILASCLTSTSPSPCSPPFSEAAVNIVSTDATQVPGYNRFPSNDFPRIAVSDKAGTVSIVWNDARANPLGDILMQSFNLGSLGAVQSAPVKLNNDGTSALHFLPAVRYADSNGLLSVSWYDRRLNPSSTYTDVYAALGVDPRTSATPSNSRVTDVSSNWLAVSSDIVPNFGDYTDNYLVTTGTGKKASNVFYVGWSDGRLGVPQPFEAHH
jgi:hypothetical protein